MDKARNLFEELDLSSDELYAKRKAEFGLWFDKPDVCLYEAVMLSLRIIPQPYHQLRLPRPTAHRPRYPDEFFFNLDLAQFHERMALSIGAVRAGTLKGQRNTSSANESEHRVTLAKFGRWATKANLKLPAEWRRESGASPESRVTSQQRKKRNNLLRIIRALMRAAGMQDEASLFSLVQRAPSSITLDLSVVGRAYAAMHLVSKEQGDMSLAEKDLVQQTPCPDDLVSIIAALVTIGRLRIDLRPRKSAAKIIASFVVADSHALGCETGAGPGVDTIEAVVQEVRYVLVDASTPKPK